MLGPILPYRGPLVESRLKPCLCTWSIRDGNTSFVLAISKREFAQKRPDGGAGIEGAGPGMDAILNTVVNYFGARCALGPFSRSHGSLLKKDMRSRAAFIAFKPAVEEIRSEERRVGKECRSRWA